MGVATLLGRQGEKGKRIYVVGNRFKGKKALEQLFSDLKKRGFNVEDSHMTDKKKWSV